VLFFSHSVEIYTNGLLTYMTLATIHDDISLVNYFQRKIN
jgi:hypothetical protein